MLNLIIIYVSWLIGVIFFLKNHKIEKDNPFQTRLFVPKTYFFYGLSIVFPVLIMGIIVAAFIRYGNDFSEENIPMLILVFLLLILCSSLMIFVGTMLRYPVLTCCSSGIKVKNFLKSEKFYKWHQIRKYVINDNYYELYDKYKNKIITVNLNQHNAKICLGVIVSYLHQD